MPHGSIEVLIPDFQGSEAALFSVIGAKPDIINHNVETVPRLYPEVRSMSVYERSLELLVRAKQATPGTYTKSGIMVGLGETHAEVLHTFRDLREAGQCAPGEEFLHGGRIVYKYQVKGVSVQ